MAPGRVRASLRPLASLIAIEEEAQRPVGVYLRVGLLGTLAGGGWILMVRLAVVRSDWLDVHAGLVLGLVGAQLVAGVLLGRRRYVTAIAVAAAAGWTVELLVTAMTPVTLNFLSAAVFLPTLLATSYMNRSQFGAMLGATFVVATPMAVAGRIQPGVGLEASLPAWVRDATIIVFLPVVAGSLASEAWQSHARLAAEAEAVRRSQLRLVSAADGERRRIEAELRRGVQRRLAEVTAALDRVRRRLAGEGHEQAGVLLGLLTASLQEAGAELRRLVHGIYPPELRERGIEAALRAAAAASRLPATVVCEEVGRYPPDVEAGVYFCCLEALRNAVDHAGPQARVAIGVSGRDGLRFEVRDTGVGDDESSVRAGRAFVTVSDRLGAIGGAASVRSRPGGGVHVRGQIPLSALEEPSAARRRLVERALSRVWSGIGDERRSAVGLRALLAAVLTSAALLLVLSVPAGPRWPALVAGLSAIAVALLTAAVLAAGRGHRDGALVAAAGIVWAQALAATALVPALLPASQLLTVMPMILAASSLARRRFQALVAATVVATAAQALAGSLLPGQAIATAAPAPLTNAVVILGVASGTAILLFLVWRSHASLTARTEALRASRAAVVRAADEERRRIERDLHDGAQQRLAAAAVQLRVAQRLLATRPDRVAPLLERLRGDLRAAGDELGDLARAIYPRQLTGRGLVAALRTACGRSALPATVVADGVGRYPPAVEVNVYFCCLEALQNAVKHAGDGARVVIRLRDHDGLTFVVEDTGRGCDPALGRGYGFTSMRNRLEAVGGTLAIDTAVGAGMRVTGHIDTDALARA